MTLYARDKFRFSFGSYSVNEGTPPTPAIDRSVGTAGCEGDCKKDWVTPGIGGGMTVSQDGLPPAPRAFNAPGESSRAL